MKSLWRLNEPIPNISFSFAENSRCPDDSTSGRVYIHKTKIHHIGQKVGPTLTSSDFASRGMRYNCNSSGIFWRSCGDR